MKSGERHRLLNKGVYMQSKEDQATLNFKSNNRYSVVNDEANTHNSDLHTSVTDSNTQ